MKLELIPWNGGGEVREEDLRQALQDEGFDVFRWRDEAGADYQPHSHDHDESLWVLDGEIVFGTAGRELRLHAGDLLRLPKGIVHTARSGAVGATYLIGEMRRVEQRAPRNGASR